MPKKNKPRWKDLNMFERITRKSKRERTGRKTKGGNE